MYHNLAYLDLGSDTEINKHPLKQSFGAKQQDSTQDESSFLSGGDSEKHSEESPNSARSDPAKPEQAFSF